MLRSQSTTWRYTVNQISFSYWLCEECCSLLSLLTLAPVCHC